MPGQQSGEYQAYREELAGLGQGAEELMRGEEMEGEDDDGGNRGAPGSQRDDVMAPTPQGLPTLEVLHTTMVPTLKWCPKAARGEFAREAVHCVAACRGQWGGETPEDAPHVRQVHPAGWPGTTLRRQQGSCPGPGQGSEGEDQEMEVRGGGGAVGGGGGAK